MTFTFPDYQFRLIGFGGVAGSGKTTAAAILEGHGFERIPMATGLKRMGRAVLSVNEMAGHLKNVPSERLCGKSPRQFLQWLGTEFGRQMIGEGLWLNLWHEALNDYCLDRLADCDPGPYYVVADDVRMPNEAAAVRALGGRVIRIDRPGAGLETSHASEALDFEPDQIIANTGSLQAFTEAVADAIADYAWT